MSNKQAEAIAHAIWVVLAGALAIALAWLIGAVTDHTVSVPIVLVPFVPLFVALATYVLHVLQPDTPPAPVAPPSPIVTPPFPPTPPAGPPTLGV